MILSHCHLFICLTYSPFTQVDLQTNSQRIALSGHSVDPSELKPDESVDHVIHHEVKEVGTHM